MWRCNALDQGLTLPKVLFVDERYLELNGRKAERRGMAAAGESRRVQGSYFGYVGGRGFNLSFL